jgi:hypothetical protein
MARMLRNLVGVKPDVRNDDLKRYVSVTIPSGCWGLGTRVTDVGFPACADDSGSEPPLAGG